tara:strand:+ start:243 stop:1742 length:1500 start_codon:yes stop_codon:yes gene_type:complete
MERFRGSSILFSKSFVDEHQFYLKSDFINKMYYYFINKGLYNIISSEIVNTLISLFTIFFTIFLYKCIDYDGIFDINNETEHFIDYVQWPNYFNLHWVSWTILSSFFIYLLCKIINIVDSVNIYKKIRSFYRDELNIGDKDMNTITWEEIINKLFANYQNDNINVYNIASRISVKDNYIISLFDKDILEIKYLTSLMEWNIYYCIIQKIFNDESKINANFIQNKQQYISEIKNRIFFVSILNYIFMPFILIFIIFYAIFNYGEKFYSKPSFIVSYSWTNIGKWKIRDYNELYHNFHERLKIAEEPSKEYMAQFSNKILETFSSLIVFITSSLFIVLLLLSFINDNILVNLYIYNKTILWYLTLLGAVTTIFKSFIKDKIVCYSKIKMEEIKKHIDYIPDEWIEDSGNKTTYKQFNKLFAYNIQNIILNILYTILIPFELWKLYYKSEKIVNFLVNNSIKHPVMGYVCKYSIFENVNEMSDKKTQQSLANFKNINTTIVL